MRKNTELAEQKNTRYKNPLSTSQSVMVWHNYVAKTITFAPGEERDVPSELDHAIHHVHEGQIIGGEAPHLINLSRPELRLAGYLDTEKTKRDAAKAALVQAQLEKRNAEQNALLAAAKAAEAESQGKASAQPASPAPETKK